MCTDVHVGIRLDTRHLTNHRIQFQIPVLKTITRFCRIVSCHINLPQTQSREWISIPSISFRELPVPRRIDPRHFLVVPWSFAVQDTAVFSGQIQSLSHVYRWKGWILRFLERAECREARRVRVVRLESIDAAGTVATCTDQADTVDEGFRCSTWKEEGAGDVLEQDVRSRLWSTSDASHM